MRLILARSPLKGSGTASNSYRRGANHKSDHLANLTSRHPLNYVPAGKPLRRRPSRTSNAGFTPQSSPSLLLKSSAYRSAPPYSQRNARTGSTRVARRAGTALASATAAASNRTTLEYASGSSGSMPGRA